MTFTAVKFTRVPVHIGFWLAEMVTTAGMAVPDVEIVMVFEVAGEPVTQPEGELISQVTLSPLARVEVVKVDAFAPATGEPLINH